MSRDDVIIPEVLEAEYYRRTNEITDVFNAASGGTIVLANKVAKQRAGGQSSETFRFKTNSDIESRMDHTSSDDATFQALTMASGKRIRMNRKLPVVIYDDDVRVSGYGPEDWSVSAAIQIAENRAIALRNLAVSAAVAAIYAMDTPSANAHVQGARVALAGERVTLTHAKLNQMLHLMKDARNRITRWAMPSIGSTELIGLNISTNSPDPVAGTVLYGGQPASLGKAVLMADIPALENAVDSTYLADFYVLGLGPAAIVIEVVEEGPVETDRNIKAERMHTLIRKDYTIEVGIQGMKWSGEAVNPTDTQLGTTANWDEDLEDHRDCGIVLGVFNASS